MQLEEMAIEMLWWVLRPTMADDKLSNRRVRELLL